jgi:ABC-type cobalamin/Fe3+-siderophores transport system ATPase subunit
LEQKILLFSAYTEVLLHASATERYKNVKLSRHVNTVDYEKPNQFSATVLRMAETGTISHSGARMIIWPAGRKIF